LALIALNLTANLSIACHVFMGAVWLIFASVPLKGYRHRPLMILQISLACYNAVSLVVVKEKIH